MQMEGTPQVPRIERADYGVFIYSAKGGKAVQHACHAKLPPNHQAHHCYEGYDCVSTFQPLNYGSCCPLRQIDVSGVSRVHCFTVAQASQFTSYCRLCGWAAQGPDEHFGCPHSKLLQDGYHQAAVHEVEKCCCALSSWSTNEAAPGKVSVSSADSFVVHVLW